jgi:hypothetical protein
MMRRDPAGAHVAARIISTSRTARVPQPSLPGGTSGRNFLIQAKADPVQLSGLIATCPTHPSPAGPRPDGRRTFSPDIAEPPPDRLAVHHPPHATRRPELAAAGSSCPTEKPARSHDQAAARICWHPDPMFRAFSRAADPATARPRVKAVSAGWPRRSATMAAHRVRQAASGQAAAESVSGSTRRPTRRTGKVR